MKKLNTSTENIAKIADIFHLMGDTSRLRIAICCLNDAIAVSDIAEQLSLSQSLVSHHLRLLKAARIMRAKRRGKQVFYTVDDHHIRQIITDMLEHIDEANHE